MYLIRKITEIYFHFSKKKRITKLILTTKFFQKKILKSNMPPLYQDTKTGLILTVQHGSTLCITYSNT